MKTKKLLSVLVVLFLSANIMALDHGSKKETGLPVYPIRDGAAPGTAVAGVTFDYKIVTIGTTTWAWTNWNGKTISGNAWSSQLRYWTPAKVEKNLTGRVSGTQQTYGTATGTPSATITFLQEDNNNFFETADIAYNSAAINSAVSGDNEKPVLANPVKGTQTATSLQLTLSATDNSGDYFYYITDDAHSFKQVSFINNTILTLTAGTTYNFSIYAIDFSGNMSDVKTVTTAIVPTADFTPSIIAGFAPLTVNFTNVSTSATSYSWNFGDTSTTTDVSPSHSFATPGKYAVTLTAVNGAENATTTQTIYVMNTPSGLPAGETVSGGDMETETAWGIATLGTSADLMPALTWNNTTNVPANGAGKALLINKTTSGTSNMALFQPVSLESGKTYTFDCALKELGGTNNFWIQLYVKNTCPTNKADLADPKLADMNTWGGKPAANFDGLFSGSLGTATTYNCTATGTYYLSMKIGTAGGVENIAIDNISFSTTPATATENIDANKIIIKTDNAGIQINGKNIKQINIYNVSGELLQSANLNSTSFASDKLSAGLYLVTVDGKTYKALVRP